MQTEISIIIPQGYWGIVKRWLNKVARAPELLGYPQPEVRINNGAVVYTTASGHGRYLIEGSRTELRITFEGRRNSFRSGIPFLGFHWDGEYAVFGEVEVVLRDVNPFAPEIVFLGHVDSFNTSRPEMPFVAYTALSMLTFKFFPCFDFFFCRREVFDFWGLYFRVCFHLFHPCNS